MCGSYFDIFIKQTEVCMCKFLLSLFSGVLCLTAAAAGKDYRENPAKYWDFSKLTAPPKYKAAGFAESKVEGLQDILFEGVERKGKKTQVFAYIAYPSTPMPKGGYPAVLLVHGGGGTAYPEFTKLWAEKGFAVLAIDWYNSRPNVAAINARNHKANKIPLEGKKPLNDIQTNVANMILAHSLLRSLPKVDPDKTVYVGLSWGSWFGATVAALDGRFKGAVEIYCGDVNLNKKTRRLVSGIFLHAARIPMFWVCSTNDANVTFRTLQRAWDDCPRLVTKSLVMRLPHSHVGFRFDSCFRMARHFALGETALPVLGRASVRDGVASVEIKSEGKGIKKSIFCYTTDKADVKFSERKWQSIPVERKGKLLTAKVPAGTFQAYFSAYDEESRFKDCCGSSNVLFFADGE